MSRGSWQESYRRKYGLEVTEQDGAVVKSARCKFCMFFGRQVNSDGRKRGARGTDQFFNIPLRTDAIQRHLLTQHADSLKEYQEGTPATQEKFFDDSISRANTMDNYVDFESDTINMDIDRKIIDEVIAELMFRPDDELNAAGDDDEDCINADRDKKIANLKKNALKLFKKECYDDVKEDGDYSYKVTIKNAQRFKLVIAYVSSGLSFRKVSAVIQNTTYHLNIARTAWCLFTRWRQPLRPSVSPSSVSSSATW